MVAASARLGQQHLCTEETPVFHKRFWCEAPACQALLLVGGRHHCRRCGNSVCTVHFNRPFCKDCADEAAEARYRSSESSGVSGAVEPVTSAQDPTSNPRGDEDVELCRDVYATAFVLANNATPSMYSFLPFLNRRMLMVWFYFLFIAFSQSFALYALVFIHPPSVDSETLYVNCARPSDAAKVLLDAVGERAERDSTPEGRVCFESATNATESTTSCQDATAEKATDEAAAKKTAEEAAAQKATEALTQSAAASHFSNGSVAVPVPVAEFESQPARIAGVQNRSASIGVSRATQESESSIAGESSDSSSTRYFFRSGPSTRYFFDDAGSLGAGIDASVVAGNSSFQRGSHEPQPAATAEHAALGIQVASTAPLSEEALGRCLELDVAFEASLEGRHVQYRKLEREVFFYQNTFAAGGLAINVLKLVCCVWVSVQVYFVDFQNVCALLQYRDFNRWLLPLKKEELRHNYWVLVIPVVQYILAVSIVSVSCSIICGYDKAFDIVLNSLAFTFISQVPEIFNEPLVRYYSSIAIDGLDESYGPDPIYYLYPEYSEQNVDPNGDWAGSWYIREDEQYAGLLNDFKFRHSPQDYPTPHAVTIQTLRVLFYCVPVATVMSCWAKHALF